MTSVEQRVVDAARRAYWDLKLNINPMLTRCGVHPASITERELGQALAALDAAGAEEEHDTTGHA